MDTIIYIALAVGLVIAYLFLGRRDRKGKPIPGPGGLPLVGYAFEMSKAPLHQIFTELAKKHGDIFQINVFGKALVVLNSTEKIRAAFVTDPYNKFLNDRLETFFGQWLFFNSQGIAFMPKAHDSVHSDLRKSFVKGIHYYGDGRKEFEEIVIAELGNLARRIDGLNGNDFDLSEMLKRSLTNNISILLCGKDVPDGDEDVDMFWDFLKNSKFLLKQDVDVLLRTFPFLRWLPGLYKTSCDRVELNREKILKRFYHDVKDSYQPGTVRGLVDYMFLEQAEQSQNLKEGEEMIYTDDRIKVTILETIGAGISTTLGALLTVFLCLIDHPECQEKIHAELDRVVGPDQSPSLAVKKDCPYIEACLLESQRYAPVASVNAIHFCYSNIEFEGYDIPKNSVIAPNIWYVHHDESLWGDPWQFRPERWLDEQGDILPNDSPQRKNWLAFGVGRRQCIGEGVARSRMFLYIATLLQHWKLELASDDEMTFDPRNGHYEDDLAIQPKPYRCRVVPRRS